MPDSLAERIRSNIRDILETIADPVAQRKYEQDVPIANVPAELVCSWFDDWYDPTDASFVEAFTASELVELASFSDFYGARVDRLPDTKGVRGLQKTPEWIEIVDRANETLANLGWVP